MKQMTTLKAMQTASTEAEILEAYAAFVRSLEALRKRAKTFHKATKRRGWSAHLIAYQEGAAQLPRAHKALVDFGGNDLLFRGINAHPFQ